MNRKAPFTSDAPAASADGVSDYFAQERLATIRRKFIAAAETWQEHARLEHKIAKAAVEDERFPQMNGGGAGIRSQYRAAKNAAKVAEEHAARCFELAMTGGIQTRRRGPGKKPKLVEPPKGDDPATAMLKRRAAEKEAARKEAARKGLETRRANEANGATTAVEVVTLTCEACGSEMAADVFQAHAEKCVG